MSSIAEASTLPSTDPRDWTRAEKIAWCRNRAMATPWEQRVESMIQDMKLMGEPLKYTTVQLGKLEAIRGGEQAVNQWVDDIQ